MPPIADINPTSVNGKASTHTGERMNDRLAIRIERSPLDGMEACNGLYVLAESGDGIELHTAGHTVYVRMDMAKELADALYRYVGAIEGDKQRYEKARDTLGRRLRNGDIPGFEDARIRIETARD